MKKLVCVILIFSLLLTMSSCSFFDRFNSDLGDISFDEDRNLVYHRNTYYKTDLGFYVDYTEGDEPFDLGRSSGFPFFPDVHYYAFDEDTPLYIYHANYPWRCNGRQLYIRSDYDLQNAVFALDGTDEAVFLFSFLTKVEEPPAETDSRSYNHYRLYWQEDPRVYAELTGPCKQGDNWYLWKDKDYWLLSDSFVEILVDHGLIHE